MLFAVRNSAHCAVNRSTSSSDPCSFPEWCLVRVGRLSDELILLEHNRIAVYCQRALNPQPSHPERR